jgi:hypothetical protein
VKASRPFYCLNHVRTSGTVPPSTRLTPIA